MNKIFAPFLPPWAETGLQPAFYDVESGTVLQQTARMYAKVQQLTRLFNELSEETRETVDELYNYVHDYFDNLDVQEEIDHKIDEMVEDGTFDAILQPILAVYEDYNFHTLMATPYYRSNDDKFGMQGGCILPDGTIIQCTGNHNENTGKILHYAVDGSILNSKTVNYGHCNGVTYNTKTNTIFITSTQSSTIGYYKVFEVDPVTLDEIEEYDCTDKEFPAQPYGIVYIKEDDSFVFVNYWRTNGTKYIWKTDTEFNVTKTEEVNVEVRSTSNIGRFGNYIGINTISDNMVMLFNFYTLKFVREVKLNKVISDVWNLTEVEWFDTRNDKIYLGFVPACATSPTTWGYGTKVYAVFDPAINYAESRKTNTEFAPCGEVYWVDTTAAYNPLRDGSENAPFENINEALNSALRTENITGDVQIWLKDNTAGTFYPFFAMNKNYKVSSAYGTNDAMKQFGGFYVCEGAEVKFNRGIELQETTTVYGESNVYCRGKLNINDTLYRHDGEKTTIKADLGSYISCRFHQYGYDLTNFYGTLENTGKSYFSSDILTIRNTTTTPEPRGYSVINYRLTLGNSLSNVQIPNVSNVAILTVRCDLPRGNGQNKTTIEPNLTYNYGNYVSNPIGYVDTDNVFKFFRVIISDTGVISTSGTPTDGITNLRVKFMSC